MRSAVFSTAPTARLSCTHPPDRPSGTARCFHDRLIGQSGESTMTQNLLAKLAVGLVLAGVALGTPRLGCHEASAQEKKAKNPEEGKKGTTIGLLVKKTDKSIEVRADGEEKARVYVPQWKGGMPADGGGPDKEMLKIFRELKVGSRVEVKWLFEERLRALEVKVLAPPKGDKN